MRTVGDDWEARFDRIERMARITLPPEYLPDFVHTARPIGSQAIAIILTRPSANGLEILTVEEDGKDWIDPNGICIPRVGLPTGGVNREEGESIFEAAHREALEEVGLDLDLSGARIVARIRLKDETDPEADHEFVAIATDKFSGEIVLGPEIRSALWRLLEECLRRMPNFLRKHKQVVEAFARRPTFT